MKYTPDWSVNLDGIEILQRFGRSEWLRARIWNMGVRGVKTSRWRSRLAVVICCTIFAVLTSGCGLTSSNQSQAVSVFKLAVGDCLVPPTKIQADLTSITVVSCNLAHTQQVFGIAKLSGSSSSYPTTQTLDAQANGLCLDKFAQFVGIPYQKSKLFFTYMLPSVGSWSAGDRSVVCVLESVTGPLHRSAKGSKL